MLAVLIMIGFKIETETSNTESVSLRKRQNKYSISILISSYQNITIVSIVKAATNQSKLNTFSSSECTKTLTYIKAIIDRINKDKEFDAVVASL